MRSLLLVAVGLVMTGCVVTREASPPTATTAAVGPAPTTGQALTPPLADGRQSELALIVEPDQGMGPIYSFISGARHSLDMTMYELLDQRAEDLLAAEVLRGVRVRVLLDRSRERQANTAAFQFLHARGVGVAWSSTSFDATHEKALISDAGHSDAEALIMTLNLTPRYYSSTRDFAVIDTDPVDVTAMDSVFDSDFQHIGDSVPPGGTDLVWSPGSADALVALIGSAHHSLMLENEEISDSRIAQALIVAARHHVEVRLVMTADPEWAPIFSELVSAGVSVRTYPTNGPGLYIHAKAIVVDNRSVFVGSQDFSVPSLDYNRELGVLSSESGVVEATSQVLLGDYVRAAAWTS